MFNAASHLQTFLHASYQQFIDYLLIHSIIEARCQMSGGHFLRVNLRSIKHTRKTEEEGLWSSVTFPAGGQLVHFHANVCDFASATSHVHSSKAVCLHQQPKTRRTPSSLMDRPGGVLVGGPLFSFTPLCITCVCMCVCLSVATLLHQHFGCLDRKTLSWLPTITSPTLVIVSELVCEHVLCTGLDGNDSVCWN